MKAEGILGLSDKCWQVVLVVDDLADLLQYGLGGALDEFLSGTDRERRIGLGNALETPQMLSDGLRVTKVGNQLFANLKTNVVGEFFEVLTDWLKQVSDEDSPGFPAARSAGTVTNPVTTEGAKAAKWELDRNAEALCHRLKRSDDSDALLVCEG